MDFLVVLFGLILGSFLNVCIYRIPIKESVIRPRSHCPYCGDNLRLLDLIPVLSYISLKGKCRYCKHPISAVYPMVEILSALFLWLIYRYLGLSFKGMFYTILFCILITATFIDWKHRIIPNGLILFGVAVGLIFNLLGFGIPFLDGLYGFLLGGGSLLLVALLSLLILRKEGMGGGDIKFIGMIGLYLGWRHTLLALILSVYIGGLISLFLLIFKIRKKGDYIPYGPFIALGTLIAMFYGTEIINWYISFF
jgi:leader peptidase (prepilin peptidase)/N-methyltransferase